jgi:RNA polymerase sigma factor for flagellar operon FliA
VSAEDRESTIRGLFPLVRRIARRVARVAHLSDLDDLVGDGSVGLIRAVDGFDPKRGVSLELYASRLIAGAMLNGLRRRDPVSERVRRTMRQVQERRYALAQERGRLPTFTELERDDPALRRARAGVFAHAALSLDASRPGGRDFLLDWAADPALRAIENERARGLRDAIDSLPERERRIVALHYVREQSLRAIGRTLHVSPQRVSQLHLLALARLRHTVPRT